MTKNSTAHKVTTAQRELMDALADGSSIVVVSPLHEGRFLRYHRDADGQYRDGHGCTPQAKALLRAGLVQVDAERNVTIVEPETPGAVEPELGFQKEIAALEARTPSAEFVEIWRQFQGCSPEDRALYVGYIHGIALSQNASRNAVTEETEYTMTIQGHSLEKLTDRTPVGSLCWQTFTASGAPWASIELRRVDNERGKPPAYHLRYLPEVGTIPAGRIVFAWPADAYRVAEDLGAEFRKDTGPRGD